METTMKSEDNLQSGYTYSQLRKAAHNYVRSNCKPMLLSGIFYVLLMLLMSSVMDKFYIMIISVITEALFIALWLSIAEKSAAFGKLPIMKLWDDSTVNSIKVTLLYMFSMIVMSFLMGIPIGLCMVRIIYDRTIPTLFIVLTLIAVGIVLYIGMRAEIACIYSTHHPSMSIQQIFQNSWDMMDGCVLDYVLFKFTFIGWAMLTVVTLGFAGMYVFPLYYAADEAFYRSLNGHPLQGTITEVGEDTDTIRTALLNGGKMKKEGE